MTVSRVHFTSKAQDWGTPRYLFDFLHAAFRFRWDVCAEPGNAKLSGYWSEQDDGLLQDWGITGHNWMNNPYKHSEEWTRKARYEVSRGGATMGLLPARTSERWWQKNIVRGEGLFRNAGYFPDQRFHWVKWQGLKVWTHYIDHRIPFEKPGKTWTAPFPSALVIWEPATSDWGATSVARLNWNELERPKKATTGKRRKVA